LTFRQARQWLIDKKIIGSEATANAIGYRIPTQSIARFILTTESIEPSSLFIFKALPSLIILAVITLVEVASNG